MLISDEPLLSGQLPFPQGWPLNRGSTVAQKYIVPKASTRLNFIVCATVAVQLVVVINLARNILHFKLLLGSVRGWYSIFILSFLNFYLHWFFEIPIGWFSTG